jgi:phospholipid/cholesterol/gamma-HCH transport system substrate-binding protein
LYLCNTKVIKINTMTISKEVKIGLLAVLTLGFGIWGYMFLKGRNILSREKIVYVEYNNVDALTESSPVTLNGFQIGIVSSIIMKPDDAYKVIVAITLRRDINVPKNAVAELASTSIMGGKTIKIRFDKPCMGGDCVESGDYIKGVEKSVLGSMLTPDEVSSYMERARNGVGGIMDSLNASMRKDDSEVGKTLRDIQSTVANLKKATASLTTLMNVSSKSMSGTLAHLESVSGNLEKSNAEITQLMSNTKDFTGKLNKLELDKTIGGANDAMLAVKKTLEKSESAVADLNSVIAQVKSGQGSLGTLIYDDKFIKNLNETILSIDMLSRDFNLHPKRYRSVLWGKERQRVPFVEDLQYQKYIRDRDSIKTYSNNLGKK